MATGSDLLTHETVQPGDKPLVPVWDLPWLLEEERGRRNGKLFDEKERREPKDGFVNLAERGGRSSRAADDLRELAEARLSSERLSIFKYYLNGFERRAREEKLPRREIEETLRQVTRVLNSIDDVPLTREQKELVAEQILKNAAAPMSSVAQGEHDSCGAAVMEVLTYLAAPSVAATIVADACLQGNYERRRLSFTVDPAPHDTSRLPKHYQGQRNHASELFQVAVTNLALRLRPGWANQNGLISYQQQERRIGSLTTGEVIIDRSTDPPRTTKFPGLYVSDLINLHNELIGKGGDHVMLYYAPRDGARREREGAFNSEKGLAEKLLENKRKGRLPAVIFVHSGNDPLWSESPVNQNGGRGSWHFMSVTDISEGPPPVVAVDSTWWGKADHGMNAPMPLRELFIASLSPEEAERELRAEVERDARESKIDTAKQIALLRQEWLNRKISDLQYEEGLKELVMFANLRWGQEQSQSKLNETERNRSLDKIMNATDRLTYDQKMRMLSLVKNQKLIGEREYDEAISATAIEMSENRLNAMMSGELEVIGQEQFERGSAQLQQQLLELPIERRQFVLDNIKRGRLLDESGFFAKQAKDRRQRRQVK